MTPDPPLEFFVELDAAQRDSVARWWNGLSESQRNAMQTLIDAPDCKMRFVDADSPESVGAVDLFADDWESTWEENWESDWREYLTEHPDVRALTHDFGCIMVKCGG